MLFSHNKRPRGLAKDFRERRTTRPCLINFYFPCKKVYLRELNSKKQLTISKKNSKSIVETVASKLVEVWEELDVDSWYGKEGCCFNFLPNK